MESTLLYHRLVIVICYNQSGRGERLASLLRPNKLRVEDGVHMAKEVWKDIPGYEGCYQISSLGRVRSLDRTVVYSNGQKHFYKGIVLKPGKGKTGYLTVRLGNHGREAGVHRLVAEVFIPNPDKKKDVNHINGDKADNRKENLEWVTRQENMEHCKKILKKQTGRAPIKVVCIESGKIYNSISEAAAETGASISHISTIINKKDTRTISGGYHWEKIKTD